MPLTVNEHLADLNARVATLEQALKRIEAKLSPPAPKPERPAPLPNWVAPQGEYGASAPATEAYIAEGAARAAAPNRKPGEQANGNWLDGGILRDREGNIVSADPPRSQMKCDSLSRRSPARANIIRCSGLMPAPVTAT